MPQKSRSYLGSILGLAGVGFNPRINYSAFSLIWNQGAEDPLDLVGNCWKNFPVVWFLISNKLWKFIHNRECFFFRDFCALLYIHESRLFLFLFLFFFFSLWRDIQHDYFTGGIRLIYKRISAIVRHPTLIPRMGFFRRFSEIHLSPFVAEGWRGKRTDEFNGTESGPISASFRRAC